MARNLAHYIDPEEQERQRLLEIELAGGQPFGPPAPPSNLGRVPVAAMPDLTTPRRTDGDYSGFHDPYQDADPSPEELAADAEAEGDLDILLEDTDPATGENPYDTYLPSTYGTGLGGYAGRLDMGSDARAARALTAAAPAPVDKKAASVSAEQKGVPAAPTTPSATAARAAAIADEPPVENDHRSEVDRVAQTPQKGQRSDFFGLDDEEGWATERERRIQAVRAAYGEEDAPSHHWEDEFLRGHDEASKRANLVRGLSFFTMDPHDAIAAGDRVMKQYGDREAGRANARAADVANARIPLALAEAITASVPSITPEAAVQLRNNSPIVKAFQNGMYSQGGRAEGQQIGLSKEKLKILEHMANATDKEDFDRWKARLGSATQLDVAEIYANKGKPTTPEEKAVTDNAAAAIMAQALGVDPAVGARALTGDYSDLSKEKAALAARLAPQILAKAGQPKGLDQVLNDSIKTQATQPIKDKYSIDKTLEMARNNPEHRRKFKTDWNDASIAFKAAWQGWKSLSPEGKAALAEWAAGGWTGKIRSFLMQPGDQERIGAVQGVINALVKDRSGSAVTGSEWERLATEMGLTADDWNPFNTPAAIESYLKLSGNKLNSHRQVFEQEYGWNPREVGDGR